MTKRSRKRTRTRGRHASLITRDSSLITHLLSLTPLWPGLLLLACVAVASYANIFSHPFVFDSEFRVHDNWRIRQLWPPGPWLTYSQRPVAYCTFALNYAIHGYQVAGYHLVNLLVHIASAWLLLSIVRHTLRLPGTPLLYREHAGGLALAIALLWVVHPLQTQAVTYTVQRIESLMGMLLLLTLFLLQRAHASADRSTRWYVASVITCWLGMATKEVMAMAPLLLLWYDRAFLADSWRGIWQSRRWYYVGLLAGWILLGCLIAQLGNYESSAGSVEGLTPLSYALSQPGVLVHYLRLCVWPVGQCLDYGWPVADAASEIVPYAGVILVLLAATVWCMARAPRLGFLGGWFFLILAPTSTVVPIRDLAFEHRMYLPSAAVVAVLVLGVFQLLRRLRTGPRKLAAAVLVISAALPLAGLTYRRNQDYASAEIVWRDVVEKAPHNPRGHNNLGVQLFAQGKLDRATRSFEEALRLDPDYVDALTNLGSVLVQQQRVDQAIELWKQALALDPTFVGAHYSLGKAYRGLGHVEAAIRQFRQALAHEPMHARTLNELGTALAQTGQVAEAVQSFETALRVDPEAAKTHYNLATALHFELHDIDRAAAHYQTALALDADYAAAHRGLGMALAAGGDLEAAAAHLQRALQLNPDDQRTRRILKLLEQQ